MKDKLIEVKHIKKYFPVGRDAFLHAVDDVSFDIEKGEIFGIVGESGSGKSTIGRCILKLVDIDEGQVIFEKKRVDNLDKEHLRQIRQQMLLQQKAQEIRSWLYRSALILKQLILL